MLSSPFGFRFLLRRTRTAFSMFFFFFFLNRFIKKSLNQQVVGKNRFISGLKKLKTGNFYLNQRLYYFSYGFSTLLFFSIPFKIFKILKLNDGSKTLTLMKLKTKMDTISYYLSALVAITMAATATLRIN